MWGDQHGQIIGLKKRERDAAAQRSHLERRVTWILQTLRAESSGEVHAQTRLIAWASDQLERALRDSEVTPFSPVD